MPELTFGTDCVGSNQFERGLVNFFPIFERYTSKQAPPLYTYAYLSMPIAELGLCFCTFEMGEMIPGYFTISFVFGCV